MKKRVIKSTVQGKCAPKFRHRWELEQEMGEHKLFSCANCGGHWWRSMGARDNGPTKRGGKVTVTFVPLNNE